MISIRGFDSRDIVANNFLSNSSLKFVHNFWVETWNLKRIFGDET